MEEGSIRTTSHLSLQREKLCPGGTGGKGKGGTELGKQNKHISDKLGEFAVGETKGRAGSERIRGKTWTRYGGWFHGRGAFHKKREGGGNAGGRKWEGR